MAATVLVVEDEPAIQELIAYNLKQAGHQPLRADNAEQAIRLVQDALPDLVLLDWMLPGLSGIEICRRLRADKRGRSQSSCSPPAPRAGQADRPGYWLTTTLQPFSGTERGKGTLATCSADDR
jgi:CheY-like chemotaxis protein